MTTCGPLSCTWAKPGRRAGALLIWPFSEEQKEPRCFFDEAQIEVVEMPFPLWLRWQHKSSPSGQGGDIGRVFNLLVSFGYEARIVHREPREVD